MPSKKSLVIISLVQTILISLTPMEEAFAQASSNRGKQQAMEYFKERKKDSSRPQPSSSPKMNRKVAAASPTRYLALHMGSFIDDESWQWGVGNKEDLGKLTAGVSYRIGEWTQSMDLVLRADFQSYELNEGDPFKMSIIPLITFPDANSAFPLYFGAGLGLGIFFKQIDDESALSLDYQLFAGIRVFNLIDSIGFSLEAGLKNHIHLLSDGQYNGVYVAFGTIFTF